MIDRSLERLTLVGAERLAAEMRLLYTAVSSCVHYTVGRCRHLAEIMQLFLLLEI